MLPVKWRASARDDLVDIIDYVTERDVCAAVHLLDTIEEAGESLPEHPMLYRAGRVAGTREMVVHPHYMVVYHIANFAIEILAVMHTSRRPPAG